MITPTPQGAQNTSSRVEREAAYWDAAGVSSKTHPITDPSDLRRMELLNPKPGKVILDAGGGTGRWTDIMTAEGASVVCGDISFESLKKARGLSTVPLHCRMDVEQLPITNASVDAVHGQDILHHVDSAVFGAEIVRILKPGGIAVFWENSGANPLLLLSRKWLCGHFGIPKWSSADEHPLTASERRAFLRHFDEVRVEYPEFLFFHYLDAKLFGYRNRMVFLICRGLDAFVFRFLPWLKFLSYRQLIIGRKTSGKQGTAP